MSAEQLDGNDLFGLIERGRKIVAAVRAGGGPAFLEVMTYRWREHVGPGMDDHLGFRSKDEAAPWIAADPVARLAAVLDPGERERIEREVAEEIADAFAFAEASPFPVAAELTRDMFREEHHVAAS